MASDTDLLDLPDESLVKILQFLNYKDLCSLSKVCQRLKSLTCDDCFWRWQCQYYYLINSCPEGLTWKETFVRMHKEYGRYIMHYSNIRGAWNKIEKFLASYCPSILESLKDGATEEQLDCEGQAADQQIPQDIRLSYRIHNGQKYGHSPGLLGGGMISTHIASERLCSIDEIQFGVDSMLVDWGKIGMCERTGACHMVSLSSGDVYISGCFEAPESQECYHVGKSFTEWFCNYADNLEKNAYYVHQDHIFRFYHEPNCVAETSGITIKPTTCFIPELSGKGYGYFFFAYRIIMSMDADAPANLSCELVTRHWKIIDGDVNVEEVNGPGVVGEHPIMKPGAEFSWISCCTFKNTYGSMSGHFKMRNLLTGAVTEVECPCFHMQVPPRAKFQLNLLDKID